MGFLYESQNEGSHLGVSSGNQSGSRWGIEGSEDLGNGYKAFFRLESGFDASTGNSSQSRLFGRWAYLGLEGDFGEVRLGRQRVYGYEWISIGSPFGTGWSQSSITTALASDDGDFGSSGRVNDAIFYTTPRVSGWQAGIGYSFRSRDTTAFGTGDHDRVLTSGVRYRRGPLRAAVTYERLNPSNQSSNNKSTSNFQVAGSYDFDWIELHGAYGHLRNPNRGDSSDFDRVNAFTGGVTVPTSAAGSLLASFQRATSSDITGWAVGYQYDLSKRTNLYAFVNRVDVQESYSLQTSIGIRHKF